MNDDELIQIGGRTYLDHQHAAKLLGVDCADLCHWVRADLGPPHTRVSGRILYRLDGLRSWMDQQARYRSSRIPLVTK